MMNQIELEELLSAYMDGELSPQNKKKVEALLKTDSQAKSILRGYLAVRKAMTGTLQHQVPAGFTTKVLAAIDATTPPPKAFESTRYETLSETPVRWKNPRIYAYPLAVLICALLIGIFHRPDNRREGGRQTADGRQPTVGQTVDNGQPDEMIIPAPLAGDAGTLSPSASPIQPEVLEDLKFLCKVENAASASTIFARVFAKHEVPWKSTSGTETVVYEISVSSEMLRKILADLRTNSVNIAGETENLGTEIPDKVFFHVGF